MSAPVFPAPLSRRLRIPALAMALAASLALAGCESSEERAARHYKAGVELVAAGDLDRALVEFRNVFKYDGQHREAREAYAGILYDRGDLREAYSQYLRLIEQYPDILPARLRLAGMAVARNDWAEAERHGRAAQALDPALPAVQAITALLDYRTAATARDAAGRDDAAVRAAALLADHPDLDPEAGMLRRLLIDYHAGREDNAAALAAADAALAAEPESFDLNVTRFRLLAEAGDLEGTGAQLRAMFQRFPDNAEVRTALTQWYFAKGDVAGAEAFLREVAGAPTDAAEGHVAVVQLLEATRGPEAARAELERLAAAAAGHPNADLFRALMASIDFEAGRRDAAIAAVEAILRDAPASEQTRRIKLLQARMLQATGNPVGARALVEAVLAEDASSVEALKLRAGWAIDADRPAEAIADLRAALNQAPRDAAIMTLMAQAHERNGARELAGEMLSLAVEVSNRAPAESLRYAAFLTADGRRPAAIVLLTDSLRGHPGNIDLIAALAEQYLATEDWDRARGILADLRALGTDEANALADRIEAAAMLGENRTAEGLAFLESLVASGQGNMVATVGAIVQTRLREGSPAAARSYLDEVLAANPDNPELRLLDASLSAATGDLPAAEAGLRALVAEFPQAEPPYRLLYGLLVAQGRAEEARALLDAALAAQPESPTFLFLKAEVLQRAGDIEGAIAVYEDLYARNSANPVIANNLASLITTFRDDAESLERASAIARRLRGSTVPAFADTYGWIELRRGNIAEAIAHLEPAARGLPDDPLVQYHLGMAYAAADRREEAVAQLTRALEIAGDSPLPQFAAARAKLAELSAN